MELLLTLLSFLGITFGVPASVNTQTSPATVVSQGVRSERIITIEGISYAYSRIGPVDPSRVSLISNLPKKRTTTELMDEYQCLELSSGGFYDTNDEHIGLFEINDGVLHETSPNALFNGFLWSTMSNASGIGTMLPDQPLKFALQTGPILMENENERDLSLVSDQNARRIVGAVTPEDMLLFIVVHTDTTEFSGPLLALLPEIIGEISKKEKLHIVHAINLDGGNHSAFYNSEQSFTELSPVGSIFCIR